MRRLLCRLALALALGGCAATPESASEPDWLQELRAREAGPLPSQPLESPDAFFRAQAPARSASPVQKDGDAYSFSLDIGSAAPVDCWIYRDGLDLAASLSRLSEETFGAISRNLGTLEARQVDGVDAGAVGASPFLALDWLYRIRTSGGPQVGRIKHLVASKAGRGLYCQHNELGYAESFRRIAGALLESLEYAAPAGPAPHFSAISTLSVRGLRIGVEHTTLSRDAEGDARIDRATAVVLPVSADTLQVSDTFEVEFARPDGSLINQVHVESSNGEIVTNLHLDPQPGGVWAVEGTFQGKPLSDRIEGGRPPSSWLGETLMVREALAGDASDWTLTSTRWIPEADPTRFVDGTLTIEEQVAPKLYSARADAAGIEADLVLNHQGLVASGSVDMGVATMEFQQVYAGGAF